MSEKKKKLLTGFSGLAKSVESIQQQTAIITRLYKLSTEGIFTNLNDVAVTHTGIYSVLPEGVLKKVAFYNSETEAGKEPKFHVFLCDSLKNILAISRNDYQDNYKIIRRKDQKFSLKILEKFKSPHFQDKKLSICMFCLRRLNSLIGSESEIKADEFNLAGFLNNEDYFGQSAIFTYDYDVIPGSYRKSWQAIADLAKAKNGFVCEKCGFIGRDKFYRRFMNIHFESEQINDKRIDRIKLLCIRCHAEENGHIDIKKIPDYEQFIVILKSRGDL